MTKHRPPSHFRGRALLFALSAFGAQGCAEDTGELGQLPMTGGTAGTTGGSAAGVPSAGASSSGGGSSGAQTGGSGGSGGGGGSDGAGTSGRGGSSGSSSGGKGGTGSGGAAGNAEGGQGEDAGRGGASGGAGGGTAGSSGSAGTGATAGAATGCADLPLCDEFESYEAGTTPNGIWSKQGGGSATVDTTRPHRGEQSVHIVTGESEGGRVWLHTTTDRVFPTRHMFGRLFMYLDALPTTEVHWDMIEAQGTADEPEAWDDPFDIALRYGGQLDENFLANFETPGSYSGDGPRTDCAKFSETRMPFGRWACMEWEFDSDDEVMRFWLDGEAVEDLEVRKEGTQCISDGTNGVWYYPTFESLNLGWREWWEAGTRELWIDDVAVADERIGCEN